MGLMSQTTRKGKITNFVIIKKRWTSNQRGLYFKPGEDPYMSFNP
jgi:hypothetical protein